MKIFAKQKNNDTPQNALPGVLPLFEQTLAVVKEQRMLLAGYAAWALMPALATFGLTFLSLSPMWETISEYVIFVGDIVLGTWISACLLLVGLSEIKKEPLQEKEVETRARKAMPVLLYIFSFWLICIVGGTYLLVLPGIMAFVWLAFASVIAVEKSDATFTGAIAASREMSRARFLRVFWRLIGGSGIFGIMYFLLCIPVLGILFSITGIDAKELVTNVIMSGNEFPAWIELLLVALSLPFLPYTAVYTVALYEALKKT